MKQRLAVFAVLVIVCLLVIEETECKRKNNKGRNRGGKAGGGGRGVGGGVGGGRANGHRKHKKHHNDNLYIPHVDLKPVSDGMAPCKIVHQDLTFTTPSTCPPNTLCNVGPINDGNGAQLYRCNISAPAACQTVFSNGSVVSQTCPVGGRCDVGPFGSILADNTFALVTLCSNTPPPPCNITFGDGKQLQPVVCNGSCDVGPMTYRIKDESQTIIETKAYFCSEPVRVMPPFVKEGGRMPCRIKFENGTGLNPTLCLLGSLCIDGPYNRTLPCGSIAQLTYCNGTEDDDDEENMHPPCWLHFTNQSMMHEPFNCSLNNNNATCSDQQFNLTLPDGVHVESTTCCCNDRKPPPPPCWVRFNNGTEMAPQGCPTGSLCAIGFNMTEPDGSWIETKLCSMIVTSP
jgi:hypothetical protein